MLSDDLKQIRRERDFIYKILSRYLNKMSQWKWNDEIDLNKSITYIDYLNMEQLKKEIEILNKKGQIIVRKIYENGGY